MNNEEHPQLFSELSASLKEAQKDLSQLKEQEFKLRFALDCANSLNWELSADLKKLIFTHNFEKMIGIKQSDYDYDFERFLELHLKPYKEKIYDGMQKYINGETEIFSVEISIYDVNGKLHWLIVRGKFINDERKLIYGVSVNITERKLFEERLAHMAYIDTITGIYKFEYIADAVAGRIESVKFSNIGLLVFEINQFFDINAVFGHEHGNAMLVSIVKRIESITGNLMARVKESEFLIIFNNLEDPAELEITAKQIINAFKIPLIVDEQPHYVSFKIGLAYANNNEMNFDMLMKDAELALNHVKKDNFNDIFFIDDNIRKNMDDQLNLTYELKNAIEQNELVLFFQPIINTKTKKAAGAEALIRWKHPVRGMISPVVFIPIAEQSGLINKLGDFIFHSAFKQLKKCLEINPDFYISVNLSALQFMSHNFFEHIQDMITGYSIPTKNLVVEITESVFIADVERTINILQELRKIGVRVSLDDFGTGYSSLSYLKKLPLDNLKIDQSFLSDVLSDQTSEAILKSIISLARNLNLSITAEGVETEGHLALLENYGCNYLQGYYFSKPLPSPEFEKFIK